MTKITKIHLINYKRFRNYTIEPNDKINILVGDNEVGKTSILEAIELVSSGNIKKVENIGIDKLLNVDAIEEFNLGTRVFDYLPKIIVELYLEGNFDYTMNGKNNTENRICDGIRLVCEPNQDYQNEIKDILCSCDDYFPFDYYSIRFSTFADEAYTGYKKKINTALIDSSNMNSEYVTNEFIKKMYNHYTDIDIKERATHKSKYRLMRDKFSSNAFNLLNNRVPADKNYSFGLKKGSYLNLENDLMIYEDKVSIDNKGTGKQIFIKTDFALKRFGENIDIVLIEEPENHLSHVNLRKLIQLISSTQSGQLFISTHSSLISTRLELNNLLIMSIKDNFKPVMLHDLKDETSKYFKKVPPANIIEYSLSDKTILVEGPSEFMLLEKFYEIVNGNKPEKDNVHILDIRGLSFKRYLEIAKITGNKVAVITDNDGNYQKNCIDKYIDFNSSNNIKVFFDDDNNKTTFEKVFYYDNKELCEDYFKGNTLEYMLNNKTEAAYKILIESNKIFVPKYIMRAIEWIKE